MLDKNDLLLELNSIPNIDINIINKLYMSSTIPTDIILMVHKNKPLDIINFYKRIRDNLNNKKSSLYKNIVQDSIDEEHILTTLSALVLQIFLFSKYANNVKMFQKHIRLNEILKVLYNYSNNYDLVSAINLLRLIKADLKVFESIYKKL